MEAKFILIAVILPVIASQGINKGKNWMLKSINFFTRSFSWPPTPPGKVFEHHHHPPTSTPQTYPLEKMQCTVPPPPNNHPGIFKESASYIKYLHGFVYILLFYWAVSLDDSAANECGKSTKLSSGSQIQLTTSGKTETGICGFLVNRIDNINTKCPYPGICARIDNSRMGSCQAKVAFTGKYFDKTPDSTQV